MSVHFQKFLIKNSIATLIVLALGAVLFSTRFSEYFHFSFIILVLIAYIVNLSVFYAITKNKKGSDNSMMVLAKSFGIKFSSYMILAIIFLLVNKTAEIKITFAILLFALYIIFTVLEITSLIKFFKSV